MVLSMNGPFQLDVFSLALMKAVNRRHLAQVFHCVDAWQCCAVGGSAALGGSSAALLGCGGSAALWWAVFRCGRQCCAIKRSAALWEAVLVCSMVE